MSTWWTPWKSVMELWCCTRRGAGTSNLLAAADGQASAAEKGAGALISLEGAAGAGKQPADVRPSYMAPVNRQSWIVGQCANDEKVDELYDQRRRTRTGTVSAMTALTVPAGSAPNDADATARKSLCAPQCEDFGISASPAPVSEDAAESAVAEPRRSVTSRRSSRTTITSLSMAGKDLASAGETVAPGPGDFGLEAEEEQGYEGNITSQIKVTFKEDVEDLKDGARRRTRTTTHSTMVELQDSGNAPPALADGTSDDFGIGPAAVNPEHAVHVLAQLERKVDDLALRDKYQRLASTRFSSGREQRRNSVPVHRSHFAGAASAGRARAKTAIMGGQGGDDGSPVDFAQLAALVADDYQEAYNVYGEGADLDLAEQEKIFQAQMLRSGRQHTVFHSQAAAASAAHTTVARPTRQTQVYVAQQDLKDLEDSDEDDDSSRLEKRALEARQKRETRITVSAQQMSKELALADAEVDVVKESKEWAGDVDSDEEVESPKQLQQRATQAFKARETRLTICAAELQKGLSLGDADVAVVAENKEWAGDDDSENECSPTHLQKRETQVFQSREKRLTFAVGEMQKDLMRGDGDVQVVAESKEWAGGVDSEDEDISSRAMQASQIREKRLTYAAVQLEKDLAIGDGEVEVVSEAKEWVGEADSDDEDPKKTEERATQAFKARETRITMAMAELQKELIIGDGDVEVHQESKEWAADDASDDECNNTELEKLSSQVYSARETRMTVGLAQLQKDLIIGDGEVDVIKQNQEWAAEVDTDDDEGPEENQRRETQAFQTREKRLTVGAVEMQKGLLIGDGEIQVASQTKEWGNEDSSDEEHETKQLEQRASQAFMAREKRLTQAQAVLGVMADPGANDME